MQNKLEQLKTMSVVVADTGDINAIRIFTPQDCTTNPSLILKAVQQPEYAHLVEKVLTDVAKAQGETCDRLVLALDGLAVAFGTALSEIVPGLVSTEVDARLSFNSSAMVHKARRLIDLYRSQGVGRERILIKLAATWEGIAAAEVLEKEGIHCNMTLIFCLEQALACARAGAYLVSPFVGRITDWYKKAQGVGHFAPDVDPGVLSVKSIYHAFKKYDYPTIVMAASFRSAAQIEALAGCDRLTISTALLGELQSQQGELTRQLVPTQTMNEEITEEAITEQDFRWALNENAMANEKLAEGIRLFHQDYLKLITFVQEFAQQKGIVL